MRQDPRVDKITWLIDFRTETRGDGLVGGNAGHGDRVSGGALGEACSESCLSGDVRGLDFLNDGSCK